MDDLQVIENMVARDGIEPPTPAFSGLDSARVILLCLHCLALFVALVSVRFIGTIMEPKISARRNAFSNSLHFLRTGDIQLPRVLLFRLASRSV